MAAKTSDNPYMSSTYNKMCKILSYVEKCMDKESFDTKRFTPVEFGIGSILFHRLVSLLIEEGYVKGMAVMDRGEADAFSSDDDTDRYYIVYDNPTITVSGLRFLAENSVLAKAFGTVKGIGDIAGLFI